MKVVYTEDALRDLEEITAWLTAHYPGLGPAIERRMRTMVDLIAR